jgi:hypothetical protein
MIQPQFPGRIGTGLVPPSRIIRGSILTPVLPVAATSKSAENSETTSLKLLLAHLSCRSDETAMLQELMQQAAANWQQEGVVVLHRCLERRLVEFEPGATRAREALAELLSAVGDDLTGLELHADQELRWRVCELISSPSAGNLSCDEVRLCHASLDPALLTVREVNKLASALEMVKASGPAGNSGRVRIVSWAREIPLETRELTISLLLKSSLRESLAAIGKVAALAPDGHLRTVARRALGEW